jgi:hypothetical protein
VGCFVGACVRFGFVSGWAEGKDVHFFVKTQIHKAVYVIDKNDLDKQHRV